MNCDIDIKVPLFTKNETFENNEAADMYEPLWEKNTLKYIPTPPNPQPIIKPTRDTSIHVARILKKGDRFDSKELCMYEIGYKALLDGYQFKTRKSDTTRYDVICRNDDCNWKIISKLTNDGTVTHIETNDEDHFKMVFIAFGVVIQSFKYHTRPLTIIDAAHLKGRYEGTNLLAVGMDGNNQIIPIATCCPQAILSSCEAVFPNAFHGYCCRHLMMNCKLKSIKMQCLFWKMCKAYSVKDFGMAVNELRSKRPDVYKKLIETGFERVYEVDDRRRIQTVELCNGTCTCRKWQVSGLPCGHVLVICRVIELTDCHRLAKGWFMRIALKGEEPIIVRWGRYGARGHNRQGYKETISYIKERTYPRGSSQQADDYLPQSMPWSFDAVNLDDP
ncbi:transposase, MuDR, MULE transposase domain protein [Tanacetum coccineum]